MKIIQIILIYCTISVSARGHGYSSHGSGSHGSVSHGGTHHSYSHVTTSHAHYTYHPPSHITYACPGCSSTHPVYRTMPPTYVYAYKESNNRFGDVLTGLALYNLGRSSVDGHHVHSHYTSRPDERCSMQVIEKSHFEETEFPCFMISSFIDNSSYKSSDGAGDTHLVDITSSQNNVKPFLSNEGEGTPLELTNSQQCVLWHNLTTYKERNAVPCGLLKEYSKTVRPAGVPVYIWLPLLLMTVVAIYTCCYCVNHKKKESVKEEFPLYDTRLAGYSSNNN